MTLRKVFVLVVLVSSLAGLAACSGGGGGSPALFSPTTAANPGSGVTLPSNGPGTIPANGSGSALLAWTVPTVNTDGSPLSDLAGYKVSYGTASGQYFTSVDVGKVTSFSVANLAPGTWYFAVTAYNAAGSESDFSNELSKTVL